MTAAPGRIRTVLREEGPSGLWWRGLGVTVYRHMEVVSRDLSDSPPRADEDAGLDEGELGMDDVSEYLQLRPDQDRREIDRRLATGHHCHVVREAGRIVSTRWLSIGFAEVPYLDLVFELRSDLAYIHDSHTAPEVRKRGLATATWPRYERLLAEAGVSAVLGLVWPQNRLGMGYVRAARGYRALGTIGCIRLGPVRIPIRRTPAGLLGSARRFRPAA